MATEKVSVPVKISANIPEETLELLRDLAARRHTTVTEALKRAIELDSFLVSQEDIGSKILIEDKDRKIQRVIRK